MERVKCIVQNVHVENAFVSSAQGIGNFGILVTFGLGHAASIPHRAQQVQKNHEKFNCRNSDIELADFIHARKGDIFIDIQKLSPATAKQRERNQKLSIIRGSFLIRQMRRFPLHHGCRPLIYRIPFLRLNRPNKLVKILPFSRFFDNKRPISTVNHNQRNFTLERI